ncbi:restriction endonuclease subunit S [Niabella digestorum]|uniref:Restriction endonuclease subunit S n=1 Tax=Niabella digestorum TaxID=3117701 RepID=A0ABU7RJF8_9BACT
MSTLDIHSPAQSLARYPAYKDSGVEWIGEMPEHWEVRKLKYLGYLFSGLSNKKGEDFSKEYLPNTKEFIPFTTICNFSQIKEEIFQYVKISKYERQNLVEKNDILFLMSSETDEDIARCAVYLLDKKVHLNSFCKGFRLTSGETHPVFINYLLSSNTYRKYFRASGRGFTRVNIKQEYINDAIVTLPPLSEQSAIAEFLDKKCEQIDRLIRIKEQQIERLQELRQAKIHQAVTKGLNLNVPLKDSGIEWIGQIPEHWEVKRLASFGRFSKGGGFSKADLVDEKGVAAILYGDIYTKYNYIINESVRLISNESASNAIVLEYDDLLFTGSGETKEDIGKCVVFKSNTKTVAGGDVIIFKQVSNSSCFLAYCLNTEGVKFEKAKSSKGEIIVHTYASKLKEISVPIPPLSEQEAIVAYLDEATNKIDQTINHYRNQIEKLKEYKQSLINAAVTGKIKVA